jgi:hypothetical protein
LKPGYVPDRPSPPAETGQRLIAFPRGREGEEELRVCLDSYCGHEFIGVRLWSRNERGEWWPTKKGVSIRLSEVKELAEVLARVGSDPQRADPPRRRDPARSRGGKARRSEPPAGWEPPGPRPTPEAPWSGFDEFQAEAN